MNNSFDQNLPKWAYDVLSFWFHQLKPADWFSVSDEVDARIIEQFKPTLEEVSQLAQDEQESLLSSAYLALAAIIVLDQFPRNIFRGQRQAFDYDERAFNMAKLAVEKGLDQLIPTDMRSFAYMPFMHHESLDAQHQAVSLFSNLGNKNGTDYAIKHRDIIKKFGRFPHRNDILSRPSTPDELDYLRDAETFGVPQDKG